MISKKTFSLIGRIVGFGFKTGQLPFQMAPHTNKIVMPKFRRQIPFYIYTYYSLVTRGLSCLSFYMTTLNKDSNTSTEAIALQWAAISSMALSTAFTLNALFHMDDSAFYAKKCEHVNYFKTSIPQKI